MPTSFQVVVDSGRRVETAVLLPDAAISVIIQIIVFIQFIE